MQKRLRICAQVMCKNKAQTVKQNVHVLDISSLQYTRNAERQVRGCILDWGLQKQRFQTTQKLPYTPKTEFDAV